MGIIYSPHQPRWLSRRDQNNYFLFQKLPLKDDMNNQKIETAGILLNVTSSNLVDIHHKFGTHCCLHL